MKQKFKWNHQKLVKAIIQQWVTDGKPQTSQSTIEKYAQFLKGRRKWYKEGTLHL